MGRSGGGRWLTRGSSVGPQAGRRPAKVGPLPVLIESNTSVTHRGGAWSYWEEADGVLQGLVLLGLVSLVRVPQQTQPSRGSMFEGAL